MRYPVWIQAASLAALSFLAACDFLVSPPDPPASPSGLVAEARSRSTVVLTWVSPSSERGGPVDEIAIERTVGIDEFEEVATTDGQAITFTDDGLSPEVRYRYQIRACNDGGCSSYTSVASAETFGALEILTTVLSNGAVGQAYTGLLQAGGAGDSYTWSITSGALPDGLVLNDTSGLVTGTPVAEGTSSFQAQARSIDGQTATTDLSITVDAALPVDILNLTLPPALLDAPYSVPLLHTGGGAEITWSVVSGTLPPGLSLDPAGTLEGTPSATDTVLLRLRAESAGESDEKDFSLTVVGHDTDRFDVTTVDAVPVDPSVRPHLDSAVVRWERAITGDVQAAPVPTGTFGDPPLDCFGFAGAIEGSAYDDVLVVVNIASIDGQGGTLAQAGWCLARSGGDNPGIPVAGIMTLDLDDLLPRVGTQNLTDLIFHEIGHVLGFGTSWRSRNLLLGANTADPLFTGVNAVAEYESLGGSGDVPVANTGGGGTRDAHWRESVFNTEVMTGYSEPVGTAQPLSRVTIASMQDLGYVVNLDEADPYSLPATMMADGDAATDAGYDLLYVGPPIFIRPGLDNAMGGTP